LKEAFKVNTTEKLRHIVNQSQKLRELEHALYAINEYGYRIQICITSLSSDSQALLLNPSEALAREIKLELETRCKEILEELETLIKP